jgi:hypothetical protein
MRSRLEGGAMKTTMDPTRPDELKQTRRRKQARVARTRRNLNWLAKEFNRTLLGDMASALSKELQRMY